MEIIADLVIALRGRYIDSEACVSDFLGLDLTQLRANLALGTAVSALRTAIIELQCQTEGVGMTEAMGGLRQDSVQLYANINRTPTQFGAVAERAVREGFAVVKCAPFDNIRPPATAGDILDIARRGLERVAAIRAAIGPDVHLLVDCHSRFEPHTAPLVAEELAKMDVGWFEEPLQPRNDSEGLVGIAKSITIPIAGGESAYGESFFTDLVTRGAVKVIMPDIKHCGGVGEARSAGIAATKAGGRISLHSPSGPMSLLASAHVTAAMPGALPLEHAVYEAPWRAEVMSPPEHIEGGRLRFPGGHGQGATLNWDIVSRHGRRWRV